MQIISVKILNYTIRNREISNKILGTVLRTDNVWDRDILANNMLFILILNNFPEHVQTHIWYHCLCNLMQIPYLRHQYCAANKLRASISRCSNAVKNVLFRSFCTHMYRHTISLCLKYGTLQNNEGRNEVRCHQGQEASLPPPWSQTRFFGGKCTVMKAVRVTLLGLSALSAVILGPHSDSAPGESFPLAPDRGINFRHSHGHKWAWSTVLSLKVAKPFTSWSLPQRAVSLHRIFRWQAREVLSCSAEHVNCMLVGSARTFSKISSFLRWSRHVSYQGWIQGGDWGDCLLLNPTKVTFFTMILYNAGNSICVIRLFCRPLFCHNSVVKVTFFTMILYNAGNSICVIRLFCRPLFCHNSVVKYTFCFLQ